MCATWLPPCGSREYCIKCYNADPECDFFFFPHWKATYLYFLCHYIKHYQCNIIFSQPPFYWLCVCARVCLCLRKSPGESGVDVVPTPAARPSLRDMHSPQTHAKSTMEEDVKRHSAPDSPPPPRKHKEKVRLPLRPKAATIKVCTAFREFVRWVEWIHLESSICSLCLFRPPSQLLQLFAGSGTIVKAKVKYQT